MASIFSNLNIENESDVEQKFIYKLLTLPSPQGLGYTDSDFSTKPNIKKTIIDKGTSKKTYFPDYIVITDGIPSVIIEAKAPDEDLNEASREGRLYASEINAKYPSGVNPCIFIFVTDGKHAVLSNWDSDEPLTEFSVADAQMVDPEYSVLIDHISKESILKHSRQVLRDIRKDAKFYKPINVMGGRFVSSQTVGENSFGANVSLEYSYLFNPDTDNAREAIVKNAYVPSKRRLSHVGSIDKIIRASIPPSSQNARTIENTNNPQSLIEEISNHKKLKNQICLLIGGVGSGKSTFTDYLREVALPRETNQDTFWLNINLNPAPISRDQIYNWLLNSLILKIKEKHADIDFDTLKTLKELFKKQLQRVEKGRGALYKNNPEKYADLVNEELKRLEDNKIETLEALISYLFTSKGKLLVIVLDNCDKRVRDDQLLMFEVATWLKNTFLCSIFLPLRDTTYDQYCDLPPLDTVIKDLVFRIDPPLLDRVLYSRLNYARREIASDQNDFYYTISNGVRIKCERAEVDIYLSCIIDTLFQDQFVRRIITGLCGSNIRRGLEIVLEFCKSGHISEDEILRIRCSKESYKLPNYVVSNILLKRKRRYYNDGHSFLLNLFHSERDETLPDPFARLCILHWLKEKSREFGPNRTKGYHKVSDLLNIMQISGHSSVTISKQLERLCEENCVVTESLQSSFSELDLVSIAPSGFIHLDLLKNITYLSAVAEDTFFKHTEAYTKIKNNMIGDGAFDQDSFETALSTSKTLIDYMVDYANEYFCVSDQVIAPETPPLIDILLKVKEYVDLQFEKNYELVKREKLIEENPPKSLVRAQVVSVQDYGLFVEFGLEGSGFISKKDFLCVSEDYIDCFIEGDLVEAEVVEYSRRHGRFTMRLNDILSTT